MTRRRSFGRVRRLPSGRYQVRYPSPDREQITGPQTFASYKGADAYLALVQADLLRGTWIDHRQSTITLREYADDWIVDRRIRETTRVKYRGLLDRHILPRFGSTELGRITPQAVRAWNASLAARHPDTAAQAYRLLATIYNTAIDDTVLRQSPCRVKGASHYRNPERPVATLEEIDAAVVATVDEYRLSIILAVWCQLRPQEILGLQRRHIDLQTARLTVEQTLTSSNGKMVLGLPKTEAGARTVHIPDNALLYLIDHMSRFVDDGPESWLFKGPTGANVTTRTLERHWANARVAIGKPELRLYDMRHTGLTFVGSGGASLAELMRRGGHSSVTAALKYQHATDGRDRGVAEGLARLAQTLELPDEKKMGHAGGTDTESVVAGGPEVPVPCPSCDGDPLNLGEQQNTYRVLKRPVQEGEVAELLSREINTFLTAETVLADGETLQPQRDSNPCRHLERVVSLASRRWGRAEVSRRIPPVLGGKDSNPQ
jgi:integrase